MAQEFNRMLVESAIRRTIRSMKKSPERAIRNLVDLGIEFSKDPVQTKFLKSVQTLLSDPNSAYYSLVKDVANSVDTDTLITFGMNLRYNGLEEGTSKEIIPFAREHPECAFVLFLKGEQIDDAFIEEIKPLKNMMVSVFQNTDMKKACRKLRASRLLYSVDLCVSEHNADQILTEPWLKSIARAHPIFVILKAAKEITLDTRQRIYNTVIDVRNSGHFPLILLDFEKDLPPIREYFAYSASDDNKKL